MGSVPPLRGHEASQSGQPNDREVNSVDDERHDDQLHGENVHEEQLHEENGREEQLHERPVELERGEHHSRSYAIPLLAALVVGAAALALTLGPMTRRTPAPYAPQRTRIERTVPRPGTPAPSPTTPSPGAGTNAPSARTDAREMQRTVRRAMMAVQRNDFTLARREVTRLETLFSRMRAGGSRAMPAADVAALQGTLTAARASVDARNKKTSLDNLRRMETILRRIR